MANSHNIYVEQGSTEPITVFYKDPDGVAIDLTDYDAKLEIRSKKDTESTLYLSLSSAVAGGITITPAEGQIDVVITDEQTALFDFSAAYYDLVIESPAGEKYRILQGKIINDRGVSA